MNEEMRWLVLPCLVLEMSCLAASDVENVRYGVVCLRWLARRWSKGRESWEAFVVDYRWICLESCERKALDTGIVTLMDGLKRTKAKERV